LTSTKGTSSALALARTTVVALIITFVPQGIWSALIVANLRTTPKIPWAEGVVAAALWLAVRYLRNRNRSASAATARHEAPRATLVPRPVLLWAWTAGACGLVALVGCWIVLASLVRMPGSVLPALSGYPWWTVVLAVGTGAAISPLCEQVGLWGYWQVALERQYSAPAAILATAIAFGVLPHPPFPAPLWPKWIFFFLTGLMFSTMAYLSDSILPGLAVHMLSLLIFFVLVWPFDPQRPLVGEAGPNGWLWLHIAQAVAFAIAAAWAFQRLRATNDRQRDSVL
jgi:membrane protease YdiL (CAAX protease family)